MLLLLFNRMMLRCGGLAAGVEEATARNSTNNRIISLRCRDEMEEWVGWNGKTWHCMVRYDMVVEDERKNLSNLQKK